MKLFKQKTVFPVMGAVLMLVSILFSCVCPVIAEASSEASAEASSAAAASSAYVQKDYDVKTYGVSEGLLSLEENAIAQTDDGQIWVGTYSGLYVFDGVQFSRVLQDRQIYSVMALLCDGDGRLWIGTNDKGLFCYDPATLEMQNYSAADGLGADSIRALSLDSSGRIVVGTTCSLDIIEAGAVSESYVSFSDVSYIISVCCTDDGDVVGATNAGDIFYLEDGSIVTLNHADMDSGYLNAVCACPEGGVLAADADHTIYRLQSENGRITETVFGTTGNLSGISSLRASDLGGYYICADNGFGYMDDRGNFTDLSSEKFDLFVTASVEDYQGNIWLVSSKQGVAKYSENMFRNVLKDSEKSQSVVNCIMGIDGDLYIGCDDGLVVIDQLSGQVVSTGLEELFDGVRIRNICEDSAGNIWVSTYNDIGLVKIGPDGSILYFNEENNNAPGSRARFVKELSDGTVLAAFSTGLMFTDGTQCLQTLGQEDGLTTTQILDFEEMEDGTILAGSDGGGIYVIKDRQVVDVIDQDDGLDALVILKIIPCADGYLYVTSNALYYDNGDTIRRLQNFPYENNYDVYITQDSQAWVSGSAGVYVVSEEDLLADEADYNYVLLNESHGFDTTMSANAWNYTGDGDHIYLCCSSGAREISINDFNQTAASANIRVRIRDLTADGQKIEIDESGNYVVPKNARRLTVYPEILNYSLTNPYVTVYMSGFDNEGVTYSQTSQRPVDFTNLPAGSYTINISVQSEQNRTELVRVQIPVTKEPRFTETTLFYILVVLGLCLVLLVLGRYSFYLYKVRVVSYQVDEMKKAREEADRANHAKTMFLARMSHEIRTPINTIMGMNELISKESDSDDIRSYAADIATSGQTLLSLIDEILDLSKLDTGRISLEESEYDTAQLFRECCNAIQLRGQEKGLAVTCNIDRNIPAKLYGDGIKIREVILNLLSNAVKYTPAGKVDFSVSVWEISGDNRNVTLHVAVTDTGVGIAQEDLKRIFGAFERVDDPHIEMIGGTGLGLNICKQLLKIMGSEIHVDSEKGVGSSFWFDLTQEKRSAEDIGAQGASCQSGVTEEISYINENARILIVDDTYLNLKVAKALLKGTRVQVDTASGGEECTHLVENTRYDLILMDHMMPQMDGVETMNWIRSHPNCCKDTPVVILTANAVLGAREEYLAAGFSDYLAKPITGKALEEVLQRYVPVQAKEVFVTASLADALKRKIVHEQEKTMLDHTAGLSYCADSEDFYREMLGDFCQEGKTKEQIMKKAIEEKAWDDFRIAAHSLKGTARMIGAKEFAETALKYETAAKEKNFDFISQTYQDFAGELDKLIEYIQNYLAE